MDLEENERIKNVMAQSKLDKAKPKPSPLSDILKKHQGKSIHNIKFDSPEEKEKYLEALDVVRVRFATSNRKAFNPFAKTAGEKADPFGANRPQTFKRKKNGVIKKVKSSRLFVRMTVQVPIFEKTTKGRGKKKVVEKKLVRVETRRICVASRP